MRIGSAIVFLCLAFIGLGFLLSDDFHIRADLGSARQELAQSQMEQQSMHDQLLAATATIEELSQKAGQLAEQVRALQNHVSQQQAEKQACTDQMAQLQRQVEHYEAVAPVSKYLVNLFSSPMNIAIFLPILPIAAISYVLVRAGKREHVNRDQGNQPSSEQSRIWVQLTQAEIKELVQKRRNG